MCKYSVHLKLMKLKSSKTRNSAHRVVDREDSM